MCKNNLKRICSISVMFAIRTNILLNSVTSLPLPSAQILLSFCLSLPRSYFIFVLSLNIYSKSISGKWPCRLPGRLTNRSCGKNILPTHLVRMQTCMQPLFSVWIQEHPYPKVSRVFGLSSLCRKHAAF